ncbi:MAG: hypothetical protein ACK40A_13645, partial [Pannonibacter indicus]
MNSRRGQAGWMSGMDGDSPGGNGPEHATEHERDDLTISMFGDAPAEPAPSAPVPAGEGKQSGAYRVLASNLTALPRAELAGQHLSQASGVFRLELQDLEQVALRAPLGGTQGDLQVLLM